MVKLGLHWLDYEPIYAWCSESNIGFKWEGNNEYMGIFATDLYNHDRFELDVIVMGRYIWKPLMNKI